MGQSPRVLFLRHEDYARRAPARGLPGGQTWPRRGQPWARAWGVSAHLAAPLQVPFWRSLRDGEIGPWVFVPRNSENICCRTFLKHKNSRKQELALRHWLIG